MGCLILSQTALARQVAVCNVSGSWANPTETIECKIGNDITLKETTLFELTKAGWSIQAVTPTQWKRDGDYFKYTTFIYLEKP